MSDDKNILELGRHEPSVESVIERLDRHRGKIKNITAIVTWDDDSADVYHDTKALSDLSFEKLILDTYLHSYLEDTFEQ